MKIEAEINKIYDEEKMKGIATVKIDDCFVVRGIRILDGEKGLHLAMPSRPGKDGKHHDVAHPINEETRTLFNEVVLDAYYKKLEEEGN